MYRTSLRALGAVAWIAVASIPGLATAAAADYYLKLGSIKGEASASAATGGQIEVLSWSWGASNSGSAAVGGGMGAGKANVQDISLAKAATASGPGGGGGSGGSAKSVDKSTPKLAETGVAAGDPDADGPATDEPARKMMGAPKIGEASARKGTPAAVSHDLRTNVVARTAPPAGAGSLTVAAVLPGCTVGTRYADAELGTPAGRYKLENVMISSCATDSVTLNYVRLRESPTP